MSPDELSGPDLAGAVADAGAVGLDHVVIGGFAVIYHGHIRATMRGGLPPLDYDTVAQRAEAVEFRGQPMRIASLRSLVGFKRLAYRPDPDRAELRRLEAIHGPLPTDSIPGLDT